MQAELTILNLKKIVCMVRRKGHILEQIADWDNLVAADKEAQAGKVKKNRHIRRHNLHRRKIWNGCSG